jgi:hypothetical protein
MSTLTAGNVTVSCSLSADTSGNLVFQSGGNVTAMTIDSSQNVGIGTSSPAFKLDIVANANASLISRVLNTNTGASTQSILQLGTGASAERYSNFNVNYTGQYFQNGGVNITTLYQDYDTQIFRKNDGTERVRIDPSGNLLVGVASGTSHILSKNASSGYVAGIDNSASTTPFGMYVNFSAAAPNDTSRLFLSCADTSATRATIRSNGGIANFSANNVNLSDERLKTDIQPAGSYLSKICAIPVKTFLYKDQTDSEPNLGVIAQDVEAVAPELVDASGFGETPEDGVPYKTIYQTDLQYALMKCIQEQQQMIEELKAKVAALEAA